MQSAKADDFKHTTAQSMFEGRVVGLDLFTETVNGIEQTVIYNRLDTGTRYGVRSIDPTKPHHTRVLAAWVHQASDVNDYR